MYPWQSFSMSFLWGNGPSAADRLNSIVNHDICASGVSSQLAFPLDHLCIPQVSQSVQFVSPRCFRGWCTCNFFIPCHIFNVSYIDEISQLLKPSTILFLSLRCNILQPLTFFTGNFAWNTLKSCNTLMASCRFWKFFSFGKHSEMALTVFFNGSVNHTQAEGNLNKPDCTFPCRLWGAMGSEVEAQWELIEGFKQGPTDTWPPFFTFTKIFFFFLVV